jgi:CRISPR/Cas system CSM-associated protein Csm5 (group 7 of RAMP superfamily)
VLDGKNGAKDVRGECKWCTTVLKLVAAKSKEVQRHARAEIEELEKKMLADAQLRDIREEAEETERQQDMLRAKVWTRANKLMQEVNSTVDEGKAVMNGKCDIKINTDSDEWERVDN